MGSALVGSSVALSALLLIAAPVQADELMDTERAVYADPD
jgi:hypothetical protein